jgi:hypothetical protein
VISRKLNSWSDARPWRRSSVNGQGADPHDPDAPERAGQHLLLHLIGVRPAPVRRPHSSGVAVARADTWKARRMRPIPLRFAGRRIPPRPEGRGFLREAR